ncbi:transmembrane exosortase [Geobacter sp. OR-1]|uniref:exosortase A n=1 Tax=Geobacter sp. OR-1 TaxID=1266765 RepID=UPI000543925E|nr:exosortase A [Geobacter sp. OR-1]GAM11587.1 transmembrane exosortase [Geobacter sp. OR-1]
MTLSEYIGNYKFQLATLIILLLGLYANIIPDMVKDWYHDDNYSHGFLVPIIAGYFLYCRREELKTADVQPWNLGLIIVIAGILQLLVAWLGVEYFTMRSSLIVVIAGLVLYFFGRNIFSIALLPICYLIFMVPLPYLIYDAMAFPLKLFVTKVSVEFLQLVGVIVMREGNIIMFPATTLEVADACSGIRSLMSLLALSVAYAFFIDISTAKRWVLIFSAVPIAILTNAVRVIVTGILAQWWGAKAAEGFFHEFAGLAVFALAMVLLVSLGALLGRGRKGNA